jgi:hypothetical protein
MILAAFPFYKGSRGAFSQKGRLVRANPHESPIYPAPRFATGLSKGKSETNTDTSHFSRGMPCHQTEFPNVLPESQPLCNGVHLGF